MGNDPFTKSPHIETFIELVRRFLTLVDKQEEYSAFDFLRECAWLLPQAYSTGLKLPDVEAIGEHPDEINRTETYRAVARRVASLLGKYDLYAEVFDPSLEREVVTSTLSDDIADIYVDLKEPLLAYERGNHNGALWQWKFTIQDHAGKHIVDALRPIHQLISLHMPPDWRNS